MEPGRPFGRTSNKSPTGISPPGASSCASELVGSATTGERPASEEGSDRPDGAGQKTPPSAARRCADQWNVDAHSTNATTGGRFLPARGAVAVAVQARSSACGGGGSAGPAPPPPLARGGQKSHQDAPGGIRRWWLIRKYRSTNAAPDGRVPVHLSPSSVPPPAVRRPRTTLRSNR